MTNSNAQSKIDDLAIMHAESGTICLFNSCKAYLLNADQIPGMFFIIVWGLDCMHSLPIKEEVELSV